MCGRFEPDPDLFRRPLRLTMIVALAIAGAVALVALRLRLLTIDGAVAATIVGAAAIFAGISWAVLLLFFFTTSTLLSRWRARERDLLVRPVIAKEGPRDAVQVLVNGGVFAVAAILSTRGDAYTFQAIAAGAIATSTSDTWSTEIGTVLGGTPTTLFSRRPVAPGTSGAISFNGTLAALTGAMAVGILIAALNWPIEVLPVFAGGLAGSITDSMLGATLQERRWCSRCNAPTERRTHSCGTTSVHRGGIRGCNNDIVNLAGTIAGAVVTWILS
jgi:uncharacterized protein (TIGR00297 family)